VLNEWPTNILSLANNDIYNTPALEYDRIAEPKYEDDDDQIALYYTDFHHYTKPVTTGHDHELNFVRDSRPQPRSEELNRVISFLTRVLS